MPITKLYGDRIVPADVGAVSVAANPTPQGALPQLQVDRFFRNGLPPSASAQNALHTHAMQAILYRSKELFSRHGLPLDMPANTIGDQPRWRFAAKTGAYTHAIGVVVVMVPQEDASSYGQNAYTKLELFTSADETLGSLIKTRNFYFGANPENAVTGALPQWREAIAIIDDIPAGTVLYGKFSDVDYGRLLCATVFDLQSATESIDGYLTQNMSALTPITDVETETLAFITRDLWSRGAAKVLSWSMEFGNTPQTRVSATAVNWIDGSTTPSASTPGYTLDMTNKARSSQTNGVPCVMQVFGAVTDVGTTGNVYLKDSAGNTVTSITNGWTTAAPFSSVPQWVSVAFDLPATEDKYEIYISSDGSNTFELYAISIYELD